jgi:KaiC/GvpD/RAD55 family RecA-like ATPase
MGIEGAVEEQRAVVIARDKIRKAFYRSYNDLDVEGIVEAIEEYVTARLKENQ